MHRKIESFVNMAAEVGGRQGRGGMVHGVRSLGSATLDLAYIAMGAFDIWWEGGCWEWDVAAGIAILQEAGGLITTANPPEDWANAPIEEVRLGSRLYLAIRYVRMRYKDDNSSKLMLGILDPQGLQQWKQDGRRRRGQYGKSGEEYAI